LKTAYEALRKETEERNQIEQQLRQAQKLESLGTLAGGIAHDFNNILAAIIGFSEMAKEDTPAGTKAQRHLDRIYTAGLRGRDLVRQILTFARQAEQEKKPLQLSSIVNESLKLLRASIPSTVDIRFTVKTESGVVLADSTQMQQMIMNLCTNGAFAMREKPGTLTIDIADFSFLAPSDAPVTQMKPGSFIKLSVSDTGQGIPPETIDRIFDPFFTTKTRGEGTGLGLSVVLGIVESHGGAITVSSEVGKGATFTVYLPKLFEDQPAKPGEGEVVIQGGNERVLFVDDEEALAEMGKDLLADLGYNVVSRTSSRDALTLLKLDPSRFDLVITDQTMPDMTGIELAKEILAFRADMPVILCTGFSHTVDAEVARTAGIKAFVMKPLTKKEIARTVRTVLDE
jgi:nitrogen-specific signal transduction histidine kinase/ActR/RegA family two-component response regulator